MRRLSADVFDLPVVDRVIVDNTGATPSMVESAMPPRMLSRHQYVASSVLRAAEKLPCYSAISRHGIQAFRHEEVFGRFVRFVGSTIELRQQDDRVDAQISSSSCRRACESGNLRAEEDWRVLTVHFNATASGLASAGW